MSQNPSNNGDPARGICPALEKRAKDGRLACAAAMKIAENLSVSPAVVGKCMDELKIKIIQCQMGLFGHGDENKALKVPDHVPEDMKNALLEAAADGNLACAKAWDLAGRFGISRRKMGGICEAMAVKIRQCQLGAF